MTEWLNVSDIYKLNRLIYYDVYIYFLLVQLA